jgi:CRISPR-associated protein Cas1
MRSGALVVEGLLLARGIDVLYFTPGGRFRGQLCGPGSRVGQRRLAQLQAAIDPQRCLTIAAAFVGGKLHNQYAHLMRIQAEARSEQVASALAMLRSVRARVPSCAALNPLRGMEGVAARHYFQGLGSALRNPLFRFADRNRRPPRDPVNAALSYLYTLLVAEVEASIRAAGLDPLIGFLHETARGRPSLALDLAEEWRPLVDRLAFGLFNRRELSPEDFRHPGIGARELGAAPSPAEQPAPPVLPVAEDQEPPVEADEEPEPEVEDPADPRPPVYLGELGRKVVIRAWSRRLEEIIWSPSAEARYPTRAVLRHQAALLARVVEGRAPTYLPFVWR